MRTKYGNHIFAILLASTFCLATSHTVAITSSAFVEIPPGVSLCLFQENDAATKTTTKPQVVSADKWHRRHYSHAGNHLADSNVQWPTQITHRKWLTVMQGQEMGGMVGEGEARSESESPESLFYVGVIFNQTNRRFHEETFVCSERQRMQGSAKTAWKTAASSVHREKVVLMFAAWACCHQALRKQSWKVFCT